MKFIDWFAGIGGFRKGMELAGHECVGFCEFDRFAVASYVAMHLLTSKQQEHIKNIPAPSKKNGEPNFTKRQKEILKEEYKNGEWYANDVRRVDAASIPKADCWCFGFPCQDISIAGNCLGFAGKRSSLFFAVTAIIRDVQEENRPSYLLIENVKNLLSVNRGFDFAKLLVELDEVGYDAEWDVLNSKNFGVPQNRERVFIVGHLRGRRTRKVFPLAETNEIHNKLRANGEIYEIAQCLTAGGNDKWQGDYIVKQIGNCMPTATRSNPNQGRIYAPDGIAPCLNKMEGGGRIPLIPVSMTRKAVKKTVIANTVNIDEEKCDFVYAIWSSEYDCYIAIRRLTPNERFRLQGWPDEYFKRAAMVNSDSQLYKQAGNGVTTLVVCEIGKKMNIEVEDEPDQSLNDPVVV